MRVGDAPEEEARTLDIGSEVMPSFLYVQNESTAFVLRTEYSGQAVYQLILEWSNKCGVSGSGPS